jgi:hypothetical protein
MIHFRCRSSLGAKKHKKQRKKQLSYWKSLRKRVFDQKGKKCAICGYDKIVEVHHIIPKCKDGTDDLNNLIVLCSNHHKEIHADMFDLDSWLMKMEVKSLTEETQGQRAKSALEQDMEFRLKTLPVHLQGMFKKHGEKLLQSAGTGDILLIMIMQLLESKIVDEGVFDTYLTSLKQLKVEETYREVLTGSRVGVEDEAEGLELIAELKSVDKAEPANEFVYCAEPRPYVCLKGNELDMSNPFGGMAVQVGKVNLAELMEKFQGETADGGEAAEEGTESCSCDECSDCKKTPVN